MYSLQGRGSVCIIDFTFDVLKVATIDQNPFVPGQQTVQVVAHTQRDSSATSSITASGRGTSTGTTVAKALPTLATTAAPTLVLGAGTMADNVTVSGRVSPQQGATVDFRLYGPNDATCSGTPVFESLNLPYPVAGGPVVSAPFTPTSAGQYRWIASYSGDANMVLINRPDARRPAPASLRSGRWRQLLPTRSSMPPESVSGGCRSSPIV